MKYKNIVVANTKGGVGKSTISFHVLPYLLQNFDFAIVEIDNNNKTSSALAQSSISHKITSVNIAIGTKKMEELVIDNIMSDQITIIDAGGGDDTITIINSLTDQNIAKNTLFIIPYFADFAAIANLLSTVQLIRDFDYLVIANNIDTKNENDIMFVSGNEDFEIPNFSKMFKKFAIIEHSHLFSFAISKKETIVDLAQLAINHNQQSILDFAKKQTKSDKEKMLKIYRAWKISKQAKNYLEAENLQHLKSLIVGDEK